MAQPNRYKYNRPSSPAKKIAGSIGKSVLPAALGPGRKPLAGAINKSVLPAARSSMQPKSGQQYQNNYGKPGELTPYNPNATPEFTQEERVQAEMDRNQAEQVAAEEDLFGQSFSESTLREEIKRQSDLLAKQRESAQRSADTARMDINEQSRQGMQQIKSTEQAGLAATAPALNGPVSQSNVATQNRFLAESQRQSDYLLAQKEQKQAEVQDFLKQADEAERNGKKELALQYRNAAIRADNDVKQMDAEYLNSLANQSAEQRANFTMFTDLANQGMILDQEGLFNMADTLGLDPRIVTDYYNAVQSTRDNKAMDDQAKAIELERLKGEFEQYQRGVVGEEAQKIDNYLKLVQSGQYSPEEIQKFAISMGIPDENNPIFMADLRMKEAQARIDEITASGMPVPGSLEDIELQQAELTLMEQKFKLNEYMGNPGAALTAEEAQLVFNIPGKSKYGHTAPNTWECAEAYNLITEGGGRAGTTYESKLSLTRGVDGKPRQTDPQIGNGLVIPIGDASIGHIETVISVDPIMNTFQTVSWNRNLDGEQTIQTYSLDKMFEKYGNNWGFTDSHLKSEYAENLSEISGSGTLASTIIPTLQGLAGSVTDKGIIESEVKRLAQSGDTKALQDYVAQTTFNSLGQKEGDKLILRNNIVATGDKLKQYMKEYVNNGGDLGIFTGSAVSIRNKLADSASPELQRLGQLMLLQLEDFGRAQTGAAIQDFEKKNFNKILPTIFDGKDLADAKIDAFAEAQETYAQTILRTKLGDTVYEAVFGGQQNVSETPDEALSDYELIYGTGGGASESVDTGFNDFFNSDF